MTHHPTHPKGTKARVLLTSVFGPYAQDDAYGSRAVNPMELYHNQVTRAQGAFSLRMFHRSFGLMFIQANLDAPCTLLDFPDMDRFVREIRENRYDVIGVGAIIPNVGKVKKMCALIREHSPRSAIVVGGHVANYPDIEYAVDADHIVKGDGVSWFRAYLGQDPEAPVKHPEALSCFGTRILGHTLKDEPEETAAILIPSVGCPVGCNFCSTSALFGGKGNFLNFYETGDELYQVMSGLEASLKTQSFFVLDENFLLHRKRALRLLDLMKENDKSWSLYVFSSARVIQSYSMEQLLGLGVSWVWMGLEGESSQYRKLNDVNTFELVETLQANGIKVLGSSIIGMENHAPDNMTEVIDYAVRHNTVFHQFMLYTANPGTPLHESHKWKGSLLPEADMPPADAHGQFRFNYRHPHFQNGEEEQWLLHAFQKDFQVNGPSLARLIRVTLDGYLKHRNHADPRVRRRFVREVAPLRGTYAGAVRAMAFWYADDPAVHGFLEKLLKRIYATFGWRTRCAAEVMGRYLIRAMKKEHARLKEGWTMEPRCFYEKNPAALSAEAPARADAVTPVSLSPAPARGH